MVMKSLIKKILKEQEDDFEWVDPPNEEPFHKILMRGNPRQPRLMDEIKRILFENNKSDNIFDF